MGEVSVSINGRGYEIMCDDGQEEHLKGLARFVDGRVGELVSTVGQVGDMRLLVLASLMIADELNTLNAARAEEDEARAKAGEQAHLAELSAATVIEDASKRIEHLAERLESA